MNQTGIITLIVTGVLLVLTEIFLPGGFVGAIGGVLLLIGIFTAFFVLGPGIGFALLVGALIFGLIMFWVWMKILPNTRIGKRFILQSDAADWAGYDNTQSSLVGKTGVARSPLHPSGVAIIEGKRIDVVTRGELIDVVTRGELIDAGQTIEVIEVAGNRIVVTQSENRSETSQSAESTNAH
ncbi:MAG: hypothetical protein K9N51_07555 [Candidatus Pacebacteria bacterium]|nr:hypothetical protein [Candidatus Paceibacterota bacterium]